MRFKLLDLVFHTYEKYSWKKYKIEYFYKAWIELSRSQFNVWSDWLDKKMVGKIGLNRHRFDRKPVF